MELNADSLDPIIKELYRVDMCFVGIKSALHLVACFKVRYSLPNFLIDRLAFTCHFLRRLYVCSSVLFVTILGSRIVKSIVQTSAVSLNKISFVGIKGTSATETAVSFACSDSSPCRMLYLADVQLTSYTGEITTSFCWQAYGSSSGLVYPPSCLLSSCNNRIIQQQAESGSIQSI